MEIPKDNEEAKGRYGNTCCGQSCLAVIENLTIEKIMEDWIKLFGEFKGYSPYKKMREYLENKGFKTKLLRMDRLGTFNYNLFYLCRVQWLGKGEKPDKPYYGWSSWFEASNHTHYILIHEGEIFCNTSLTFNYHKLADYLGDIRRGENGVITSVIEINKQNENKN